MAITTPPATPEYFLGIISTGKLSNVLKRSMLIIPAIIIIMSIENPAAGIIHSAKNANIKLGTNTKSFFDTLIRENKDGTSITVGIPTHNIIEVNKPLTFMLIPFSIKYVGIHPDQV